MNSTRCLADIRTAVQRLSTSSIETKNPCRRLPISRSLPTGLSPATTRNRIPDPKWFWIAPSRCFSQTVFRAKKKSRLSRHNIGGGGGAAARADRWSRVPTDEAILQFDVVYVVGAETQRLTGPFTSREVLQRINLANETIRVVQADGGPDGKPVCRIFDRREELAKEQEQQRAQEEKASKERQRKLKMLELGWAIEKHDLGFKLQQLRKFLGQGHRVEVVFLKRRGMREVERREMEALVRTIRDEVGTVPGAREAKSSMGSVGGKLTLFLEGPDPASRAKTEEGNGNKDGSGEAKAGDEGEGAASGGENPGSS